MIKVENVTQEYFLRKEKIVALDQVSLVINDEETLGIVGYSGAGKSTLLRMFNGLIRPTMGSILVDDTIINTESEKNLNTLRKNMGMIFQNFNLLSSISVYKNVEMALLIANYPKSDIENRVNEVLEQVGLSSKKNQYPAKLSGGEKQRVGIARAIANKPKYLLCDEITSSLDNKNASDIIKILKDIKEKYKMTIIFISHQIEVVKNLCDRVIVMDKGKIVEDDSIINVFTKPKHIVTRELVRPILFDSYETIKGTYQLIYNNEIKDDNIITQLIKKFDIDVSIVHAKMTEISSDFIGYLYVRLKGINLDKGIEFLLESGIEVNYID